MPAPDVADRARRRDGRLRHGRSHLGPQPGRRRLLDDLLVAALHRAVAIEQRDDVALRVREYLHLDVPRRREIALEEQPIVAEGGAREALRRFDRGRHLARRVHDLHALAAAAGARLDDQREADSLGLGLQPLERLLARRGSPEPPARPTAAIAALEALFEPMARIAAAGGPTNIKPASTQACAKSAFSDKKAVARMHRIGADAPREHRCTPA